MIDRYYFDGACFPNPNGHASCGALLKREGQTIWTYSEYLGDQNTSNNVAEYAGVIAVLKHMIENSADYAVVYGDSNLVVKQLNGEWRAGTLTRKEKSGKVPIRPRYYLPFYHEARKLAGELTVDRVSFRWLPREQNTEADDLSTQPLRDRGYREVYTKRELADAEHVARFNHAINK